MASRRLTLHLDPVRSAENLLLVLDVLARSPGAVFPDYGAIAARIRDDYAFTDRTEPLSLLRLLGLLVEAEGGMTLSESARAIAAMRPGDRADVLHFMLATAWRDGADPGLACAWVYRAFGEHLWARGTVTVDAAEKTRLVADLLDVAAGAFPDIARAALSPKSILGMTKWLDALDPPVMQSATFRRRDICSPALLLLALGHAARADGADLDADLLMTPARREAVCRLCLLEPAALDRALDRAIPAFPALVAPGTRTGAYGRFVRLRAFPTVEALAIRR